MSTQGSKTSPRGIERVLPYVARDRREAMRTGEELSHESRGSVLFADISGFSQVTEAFVTQHGSQHGADELSRWLNAAFDEFVAAVHRWRGSVVGFSGDALTCWFDADDGRRAVAAALFIQELIASPEASSSESENFRLAVKISVSIGPAYRFAVGDPAQRLLDVLAGDTVLRAAEGERLANRGELVVDLPIGSALEPALVISDWRGDDDDRRRAVVRRLRTPVGEDPWDQGDRSLQPEQVNRWLLREVRERLLAGGGEFLAELRHCTTLFLHFSGLEYDGDPAASERLDAFIKWAQEVLTRTGGNLVQLTLGDKGSYLYAAFGAPLSHSDDPSRAATAALKLLAGHKEHSAGLTLRIGLAQGPMRAGAYGGQARRTYGVLGQAANTAAALMQRAQTGEAMATREVAEATAATHEWGFKERARVKGHSSPIQVWALHARRQGVNSTTRRLRPAKQLQADASLRASVMLPAPTSLELSARPTVGRRDEKQALRRAFSDLLAGRGALLCIEAEEGLGKSALISEAARDHARDVRILSGAGDAIDQSSPYHVWVPVFVSLLGLRNSALPQAEHLRLLRSSLPEALRADCALLSGVLPIDWDQELGERAQSLDAEGRSEKTAELLLALLEAAASERPTMVLLEDLQWADTASRELLRRAARQVPKLGIIVSRRPSAQQEGDDQSSSLSDLPRAVELRLGPLSPEDVRSMLCDNLSVERIPDAVFDMIVERAEGHPLFSEELLYALQGAGLLAIEGSECRLVGGADSLSDFEFPATLQGVITSRVDSLTPSQLVIVKVASVIGRRFLLDTLQSVHPDAISREELNLELDKLQQLGLLTLLPSGQPAAMFKHALTRFAVYNLMPLPQRGPIHLAVASWIEGQSQGDQLGVYSLLAHHFSHAYEATPSASPELLRKTIVSLEGAGHEALESFTNQEAASFFEKILSYSDQAESSTTGIKRANWHRLLGEAYYWLGRLEDSRLQVHTTLALLDQPVPRNRAGVALDVLSALARQTLHRLGFKPRRLTSPEELERFSEAARGFLRLGIIAVFESDAVGCTHSALRALNLAERAGEREALPQLYALTALIAGLVPMNRLAEGYSKLALNSMFLLEPGQSTVLTEILLCLNLSGKGRWPESQDLLHDARATALKLGVRRRWEEATALLAVQNAFRGRSEASLELWQQVYESGLQRGDPNPQMWGICGFIESHLRMGTEPVDAKGVPLLEYAEGYLAGQIDQGDRVRLGGLAAALYWRSGRVTEAFEAARVAAAELAKSDPTALFVLEGWCYIPSVLLAIWEQPERRAELGVEVGTLRSLCRGVFSSALDRMAKIFPVGAPRIMRLRGLMAHLEGHPRRAQKLWKKALRRSRRLALPFDTALLHFELGRHFDAPDANREPHLRQAMRRFERLEARHDLARAHRALELSITP